MLELDGVHKRFGDRVALDDLSFTVREATMTGFVGGNGAGKTTTMRIILGVLAADAGAVRLDGAAVTGADRRRFGYMPEERGLYPKMKVRDHLVYLARLHGWSRTAATRHAEELIEQLALTPHIDDPVQALSLGNQQRAQVAAALVHQPDILILDEPFSGLDPMAVDLVQQVLHDRAARGLPVLFSSHQLDIVERLCDDLVIISAGRIAAADSRDRLRERHAGQSWELVLDGPTAWVADALTAPGRVLESTTLSDGAGRVVLEAPEDQRRRLLAAASDRAPVRSWRQLRPSLAEIFKEVVA